MRLAVTDLSGNPKTTINVGDNFQLRAFVSDVRANPTGALAIYEDITWNGSVASVVSGSVVYGSNYNQNTSGTISAGLLDEIGASSGSASALGGGEFLLFQANLHADAAGSLAFVGNAADVTPTHNVTMFGGSGAVPLDEIDFGQTLADPGPPGGSEKSRRIYLRRRQQQRHERLRRTTDHQRHRHPYGHRLV